MTVINKLCYDTNSLLQALCSTLSISIIMFKSSVIFSLWLIKEVDQTRDILQFIIIQRNTLPKYLAKESSCKSINKCIDFGIIYNKFPGAESVVNK